MQNHAISSAIAIVSVAILADLAPADLLDLRYEQYIVEIPSESGGTMPVYVTDLYITGDDSNDVLLQYRILPPNNLNLCDIYHAEDGPSLRPNTSADQDDMKMQAADSFLTLGAIPTSKPGRIRQAEANAATGFFPSENTPGSSVFNSEPQNLRGRMQEGGIFIGRISSLSVQWYTMCRFELLYNQGPGTAVDMTLTGILTCPICYADLNDDAEVDANDLGMLLASWGDTDECKPADLNSDGSVNADDLGRMLAQWGPAPCW